MELSERATDHSVSYEELDAAIRGAAEAYEDTLFPEFDNTTIAAQSATHAASYAPNPDQRFDHVMEVMTTATTAAVSGRIPFETEAQVGLIRDIFDAEFHSLKVEQSWLARNDRAVHRIARAIYDEYAFDHMPVLADALEDAGCDNADILAHCRSGGEHVRGCWVIDLLLGKS